MMDTKKILLISGSPRKKGTSLSFARTIKKISEDAGCTSEIIHVIDYFDGKESFDNLKSLIAESDIVALTAPLYADALPYPDIWFLEKLSLEYRSELKNKSMFAIGQCGFPDVTRCYPLLDECKFFAEDTGMKWLGGLGYGLGPMINGANLEDLGKKGQKIINAFKLALENVLKGENISPKCQEIIAPKIPVLLFWPMALIMNHIIRKNGRKAGTDVFKKAYLE